jgi:NTE family protein
MAMEAYAVFQGGGAKGYAHVGALAAAEERNIIFRKVAGTSAGAIVAALAAAGYKADEIYNPDAPLGTRGIFDVTPDQLLDGSEYARIRKLARLIRRLRPDPSNPPSFERRLFGPIAEWLSRRPWGLWLLQVFILLVTGKDLGVLFSVYGLTGTQLIETWIEDALSTKMGILDRPVTFADLGMRLRVIAASLTTGELRAFGRLGDEDLSVSQAVAASACYPIFFRPAAVGHELFVDGGLVSNLPAWVFDEERDEDEAFLPTFGFRLVNDAFVPGPPGNPATAIAFAKRLFETILSGAKVEERGIRDYYAIDLSAPIGTLSFDDLPWKAPDLVRNGRECVRGFFKASIGPQDPERMKLVLRALVGELMSYYDEWRMDSRIRASIALPQDGGKRARTTYCFNMDSDGDDRLNFRIGGLGVGACFERREPIYITYAKVHSHDSRVNKYEMTARPADVAHSYAIPIFADPNDWFRAPRRRSAPFAVLVIDKALPIDDLLGSYEDQDTLANLAMIVGEELHDRALVRQDRRPTRYNAGRGRAGMLSLDSGGAFQVSRRKVRDVGQSPLGEKLSRTIDSAGAGRAIHTPPAVPSQLPRPRRLRRRKLWHEYEQMWRF